MDVTKTLNFKIHQNRYDCLRIPVVLLRCLLLWVCRIIALCPMCISNRLIPCMFIGVYLPMGNYSFFKVDITEMYVFNALVHIVLLRSSLLLVSVEYLTKNKILSDCFLLQLCLIFTWWLIAELKSCFMANLNLKNTW